MVQKLCATQTKSKKKKKKKGGNIIVFLHTLFVEKMYDREYVYLGLRPWVQV